MKKYGIGVSEERLMSFLASPRESYLESNGFGFYLRSQGEDIFLWSSPYILGGEAFLTGRKLLLQTVLFKGKYPSDEKVVMHDNDFISVGWNPPEEMDIKMLKVEESKGSLTWSLPGLKQAHRPPSWQVDLNHAGVGCHLNLKARTPPFWYLGPYSKERFEKTSQAGMCLTGDVKGSLRIRGRSYRVQGDFWHEHMIIGAGWDMFELYREHGMKFQLGMADGLVYQVFYPRATGGAFVHAKVNGRQVFLEPDEVEVEDVEFWDDPGAGTKVPTSWHVTLSAPNGLLDVRSKAFARAYYIRVMKRGYIIVYWMMAAARGRFIDGRGNSTTFEDIRCVNEYIRPILYV